MTPPNDILGAIARRKRWERDHLRSGLRGSFRVDPGSDFVPGAEVLERAKTYLRQGGCERERRPWAPALSRPERLSVVAELKRRSPSAGELATWTDPEPLAQAFEEAGAAALSVLTDAEYFGGRPSFLPRARAAVSCPVLRKDFLGDELDLAISAALGADAVLLIAALLGPELEPILRLCGAYALEALVEVHDERELDSALIAGAPVVGVNNRNLKTFAVDLGTTEGLAARIPTRHIVVGESGVRGPQDALRMRRAGVDAILVGSHLAEQGSDAIAALQVEQERGHRPGEWLP